jgi:hypothetical protein
MIIYAMRDQVVHAPAISGGCVLRRCRDDGRQISNHNFVTTRYPFLCINFTRPDLVQDLLSMGSLPVNSTSNGKKCTEEENNLCTNCIQMHILPLWWAVLHLFVHANFRSVPPVYHQDALLIGCEAIRLTGFSFCSCFMFIVYKNKHLLMEKHYFL